MDVDVSCARESTGKLASVWRLAAVPFALGAGFRVLLVVYVQVLHGSFLFLDDQGYQDRMVARSGLAHNHSLHQNR